MAKQPAKPAAETTPAATTTPAKKPAARKTRPAAEKPTPKRSSSRVLAGVTAIMAGKTGDHDVGVIGLAPHLIGIPFPAISLEYLYQLRYYPVGRVEVICGKPRSNKTSYAIEHMRWFRQFAAGIGFAFDCEDKWPYTLSSAILGYAAEDEMMMSVYKCRSTEDWQAKMMRCMKEVRKKMESRGVGRRWPVAYILDSLSGRVAEKTETDMVKRGYASKRFADEAKLHTDYLKMMAGWIGSEPFSLLIINHLKEGQSENGYQPARVTPGGAQAPYTETFEMEMSRRGNRPVHRTGRTGEQMRMLLFKNSLGETGRYIDVTLWFQQEQQEGGKRLKAFFDWHAATIDLLASRDDASGNDWRKLVGLQVINKNKAYSTKLGVSKANACSFHDLGLKLHKHRQIKDELRDAMGISLTQMERFDNNRDYLEHCQSLKIPMKKAIERLEA